MSFITCSHKENNKTIVTQYEIKERTIRAVTKKRDDDGSFHPLTIHKINPLNTPSILYGRRNKEGQLTEYFLIVPWEE